MTARPDMASILGGIGLADLVARFHAEDIDDTLFLTLGEAELKELGLTIGQRKKVIAAIRAAQAPDDETLPEGFEMRRLTVLFVDMIGSTRLAERLTPDEMNDLFQSFYLAAGVVARRFGGYVASLQGDGVIMLFGYPRTRLGDGERALGAAMAMQQDLTAREYALPSGRKVEVSFRIGVATGPAVVGRPSEAVAGDGLHMVGQVMHRASRLQGVAPPDGIMVDGATRDDVGDLFLFEDRPGIELKGIDRAEGLGLLLRRAAASQPVDEARGEVPPTLGRDDERDALLNLWSEVEQGACRAALLTGGPGLGKTALLREAVAEINQAKPRITWLSCRSLSQNSALAPVVRMFDRLIGDTEAATPTARAEALRHVMSSVPDADLDLLSDLLSLDRIRPGSAPRPGARAAMIDLLARWLIEGGPKDQPVVLVLEDAHWCDATTRELLETCATLGSGRAVFFVATSRNREEPLWQHLPERLLLALDQLDETAAEALLEERLGAHSLPVAIRNRILTLSEGNPLMLESLARAFGQDRVGDLGRDVSVPQTIYESVAERIETLNSGRGVASALAVLDSDADPDLLARMLGMPVGEVDLGLQELLKAGIIAAAETGASVHFYHHLYRDVVYERLIGADRRDLHRRALAALQDMSLDIGQRSPDVLATHALAAGALAQAAPLALTAGERFLAASALVEADHFLEKAGAALDGLPASEEQKRLRLRVLTGLAAVKRGRLSIAHDDVGALARQVLALASDLGDTRAEFLAQAGLYAHALVRADYRSALEQANGLVASANVAQDRVYTMISRRAMGQVALHVGQFDAAELELRAALAAYDRDRDLALAYVHGYDHAEISAVFLSFTLWMRGDLVGAREMSRFSVDHSHEIAHAHSLGQAQAFRAMLGAIALDDGELAAAAGEAVATADRYDIKVARGAGLFFGSMAQLLSRQGVADAARLQEIEAHFTAFREFNPYNYGPLANALRANAYLLAGQPDRAEAALATAREVEDRTGETWTAPEIARLTAQVARVRGATDKACELAEAAFALADRIGATTPALRIACDLVEVRGTRHDHDRMHAVADRIISWDGGWDQQRYQALSADMTTNAPSAIN